MQFMNITVPTYLFLLNLHPVSPGLDCLVVGIWNILAHHDIWCSQMEKLCGKCGMVSTPDLIHHIHGVLTTLTTAYFIIVLRFIIEFGVRLRKITEVLYVEMIISSINIVCKVCNSCNLMELVPISTPSIYASDLFSWPTKNKWFSKILLGSNIQYVSSLNLSIEQWKMILVLHKNGTLVNLDLPNHPNNYVMM